MILKLLTSVLDLTASHKHRLAFGTVTVTFFDDEGTFLGLGGRFTQATHVLRKDPEEILISNHQLRDGDAGAMVVFNACVPFL